MREMAEDALVHELQVHQVELEMQNDELRRTQLELEDARDRFVDLYDFAPVGYLTLDDQGAILEANLTAASMLELERQQLIGRRLGLLVDRRDRGRLSDHFDQLLHENDRQTCEVQLRTSSGSGRFVQLDSIVCVAADRVQFRTSLSDVTDRRRLQDAVLEQARHLEAMANAVPVLISYVDPQLRFRFTNATYEDWFGKSAEALQNQHVRVIHETEFDEIREHLVDAMAGQRIEFEMELRHRQAGPRQVKSTLIPDVGADGALNGVHWLSVDVTDHRLAEERKSRRQLFEDRLARLNTDERATCALLLRGTSNKAVAFELNVGLRTVERRRRTILKKLEVESVHQILHELIDLPDPLNE